MNCDSFVTNALKNPMAPPRTTKRTRKALFVRIDFMLARYSRNDFLSLLAASSALRLGGVGGLEVRMKNKQKKAVTRQGRNQMTFIRGISSPRVTRGFRLRMLAFVMTRA